ncbi:MAG TPA: hypothetical protein VJN18_31760 [Polyangiaceae bacterium]|nr:hypothetical protein [Polyangiaceae bacterium]
MSDDSSYDLCRKLAFLCSAAGIAKVEGERVARAFFELPQHRPRTARPRPPCAPGSGLTPTARAGLWS